MGAAPTGISGMIRRRPFLFVFGLLMVASAVLLLHYRSKLNFMLDDWMFVVYREDGGLDDYLAPHNEHISILPVAIFKLFLNLFGMGSAMPLHLVSLAAFFGSVIVLFIYLRRLVGEPAAVIACAVILFFGSAWEDLLWAFQIGFSISIGAGIGALLMLERRDAFGDRVACLLLVVAMISTSLGVPFAIGAGVLLLLQREDLVRRSWIVLVPVLIYVLWYVGWGHTAESNISLDNVLGAPGYIARSFALTATELTGTMKLFTSNGNSFGVTRGILGVMTTLVVIYGLVRQGRIPKPFLVAIAIALAFWGLAALNLAPGRTFEASRYQLPNAVFVLMILAGAFEGYRPRLRVLAPVALVALVAIVVNVDVMRTGYANSFKPLSDKAIAGLTAFDIARATVSPGALVGVNSDDAVSVGADAYFAAEDKYGSAAWSEEEIADSPPAARAQIDQTLVGALPITGRPLPPELKPARCQVVTAGTAGSEQTIPLPARTFVFRPRGDVFLAVGRYGDGATTGALLARGGSRTMVHVPPDSSSEPWEIGFLGAGPVRVCEVAAR